MKLEAVRNIADWLAGTLTSAVGADRGVNVAIAALWTAGLRDAGDAPPANVTIVDATRNPSIARLQDPDEADLPAVAVSLLTLTYEAVFINAGHGPRVGSATILVRYVGRNSDSDEAVQDADYTHRAILLSWALYCLPETQAAGKWTRNAITVSPGTGEVEYQDLSAQREDNKISFAIALPLVLRDAQP